MEKAQIEQQADEGITKIRTIIADPSTATAHKSVLSIILAVILKYLPVLVDIIHDVSASPIAASVLGAPAIGDEPGIAAPSTIGDVPDPSQTREGVPEGERAQVNG